MVSDSTPIPHAIHADVACYSCGYRLVGIAAEGRCPECGNGTDRSLRGDAWSESPRDYAWHMVVSLAMFSAACFTSAFADAMVIITGDIERSHVHETLVGVGVPVIGLIAGWASCRKERGVVSGPGTYLLRSSFLALCVVFIAEEFGEHAGHLAESHVVVMLTGCITYPLILGAVVTLLVLYPRWVRHLASRGRPSPPKWHAVLVYAVPVSALLCAAIGLLAVLTMNDAVSSTKWWRWLAMLAGMGVPYALLGAQSLHTAWWIVSSRSRLPTTAPGPGAAHI